MANTGMLSYISPDKYHYKTIPQLLKERAEENPNSDSYVFWDYSISKKTLVKTSVSVGDLQKRSINLACQLLKIGLQKGDRIAIFGRSILEWIYLEYACYQSGFLLLRVPTSVIYSAELPLFVNEYQIIILVLDLGVDDKILDKLAISLNRENILANDTTDGDQAYPKKLILLRNSMKYPDVFTVENGVMVEPDESDFDSLQFIYDSMSPDDKAVLFPTSGSTGIPKQVVHSHFSLINGIAFLAGVWNFPGNTSYFNPQLFQYGSSFNLIGMVAGVPYITLLAADSTPTKYAELMFQVWEKENVSSAFLPLYLVQAMKQLIENQFTIPSSLPVILTGTERIPVDLLKSMNQITKLMVGYASTETIAVATAEYPECLGEESSQDTTLTPLNYVQLKIVDDLGRIASCGVPGTILCRSSILFMGYLDHEEATADVMLPGGWYNMGDIGIIHPNGRLQIIGRNADVIIKGGIKIYAQKQEGMLLELDKVEKAYVCAIPAQEIAIPGQEIAACVIPKEGVLLKEDELYLHCQKYQPPGALVSLVPKYFIVLEKFPLLPNGKMNRMKIKGMLTAAAEGTKE